MDELKLINMLADTLQAINHTEEQAEKMITQAQVKVREIEKQTYQRITKIENDTTAEIAETIAKLPQPEALPEPTVLIEVPKTKMDAAVNYIIEAVHGA